MTRPFQRVEADGRHKLDGPYSAWDEDYTALVQSAAGVLPGMHRRDDAEVGL